MAYEPRHPVPQVAIVSEDARVRRCSSRIAIDTTASNTSADPADRDRARHALSDPWALHQDRRELIGETRSPLRSVELVPAEVREGSAVDLEPHTVDRVELGQRVDDLRETAHRDRRSLLRAERRIKVHGGDSVIDRELEQTRPGIDRGPDVRVALRIGRPAEERLECSAADPWRERLRPVRQEQGSVVVEPEFVGHRPARIGRRAR